MSPGTIPLYVFLDLDDTILQTLPKCPAGEPVHPTAYRRDGTPLSFMTARQQGLLKRLTEAGTVIPTTARNLDAFRRVDLPFRSLAILDFGGVVLLPDGRPDPEWDEHIRPQALAAGPRLEALRQSIQAFSDRHGLGAVARVICDFAMPLYVVVKHPGGAARSLETIRTEHLATESLEGLFVHHNDNNLSLVPRFLGKNRAVRYVIERHLGPGPVLTLGVADSLTDAPFLALCDYVLIPRGCQLHQHTLGWVEEVGPAGRAGPECRSARGTYPTPFSGSYRGEDVTFLLKPVRVEPTPIAEKEHLIQSGRSHYSEMIGPEQPPSPRYLEVFHHALARQKARFARDLATLARGIAAARSGEITLVSLARAGTPVGVLLARALRRHLGRSVTHYSVSIIRDRGIDEAALLHILHRHPTSSVVFVDGWTGKGVIARELEQAVSAFNHRHGTALDPGLFVVADLSGTAAFAATGDDYLIPSSVLGATISGLVSRSILNEAVVRPGDFHACVYYQEFAAHDLSGWFVDEMAEEVARQWNPTAEGPRVAHGVQRGEQRRRMTALLDDVRRRFAIRDVNHVKPGVGEATRVLLRRVPDRLLLRDERAEEVEHLVLLARDKGVPVLAEPELPYLAVALIKELDR
ncbi:MAG: hypothetical protein L0Z62_36790 [Gemmataceae bacterium]|nr:hypothetical protein [Gemmataceae bacterium]